MSEFDGIEGFDAWNAKLGELLGCGVPVEHAGLQPGQVVLDLGSGAGLDAFVARSEVGETGHVIGVDMTSEMIARSRENADKSGFDNVEFRLGEIEHLPVAVVFSQNRRRRNTGFAGIAADDGAQTISRHRGDPVTVDEHLVGFQFEPQQRAFHRQQAGLENIDFVDLGVTGLGHGPGPGVTFDFDLELQPSGFAEFLRVVQALDRPRWVEDDGGRDDRTRQRTAAGLVDTGDQTDIRCAAGRLRIWDFKHI